MKKICLVILLLCFSGTLTAQEKSLLDYDECKDGVSKSSINKYKKALSLFKDKKYSSSSLLLQELIKEEEDFASPYFLMGMIGVIKNNDKMITKYFPLVRENCPEFSHPYLYYYMGLINYTEERYNEAVKDFEEFLKLSEGNNFYDSLQRVAINYIDWSDFLHRTMENKVEFHPYKIDYLRRNMTYYEPFITWDGNEIFFIREHITKDTNRDGFLSSVKTSMDRISSHSVKDENDFYDQGFALDSPFNIADRESGVSVTADNNYLFFSKQEKNSMGVLVWNMYCCENFDGTWSDAKPININTESYNDFSPFVTCNGSSLYFVSDRPGGRGGYDIYKSIRVDKDNWGEPINLGRNVNTFADETFPFVSMDNNKLYFLSNGRKTLGGNDIFCYDISADTPAENLGYPINTENNEHSLGIKADGKTAYTTLKNSDNNFFEINTFTLPEKFRAKERNIINGTVINDVESNINLSLLDCISLQTDNYFVADGHNNFSLIVEPDKDYILFLQQTGCMFYAKKVNTQTKNLFVEHRPIEHGALMELNDIILKSDNNNFDEISNYILDGFVSFLKTNQRLRITLTGEKLMLSKLKTFLIKSGIREDRIEITVPQQYSDKITYRIK